MTLSKLSLRNAKRQARDYLVYFVTIVMAAALIYAFNCLVFSQEIRKLSTMMDSLPLIVVLTSITVVCIIGWLVSYTTKFMLKKRSRELGTYILIGLENKQVARLFFLENLVVGAAAVVLGTLLGNLIFQALRAMTLSLFHVAYQFSYAFSIKAIALSLAYFAVIYLIALVKSRRAINKMKIYDLMYFERQNEGEVIKKERQRRRIFQVSIVLGVLGTLLLLLRSLVTGILGAVLITLFLYGFFISFSSGVPEYFRKRPEKKYSGQTLLIFRSLSAKLATMGVVMATIALLFTGTLIAEGSGMVFNALFQSRSSQTTCFDLFLGSTDLSEDTFDEYFSYIDEKIPVKDSWYYQVYLSKDSQVKEAIQDSKDDYVTDYDKDILMRASDYRALRAMLGYSEAELEQGKYLIHCMGYLEKFFEAYEEPIEAGGSKLAPGKIYTEPFTQALWDGNGRGYILVVPDELLEQQPVSHKIYAAMTPDPVNEDDYEQLSNIRDEKSKVIDGYDTIFSKALVEEENNAQYAMIVFPLYYLALVLTMVAATILTIQQLSEAGRYQRQFRMLNDLGMDRGEMKRALRTQFTIFYVMPALPPILISVPFIAGLCSALEAGALRGPADVAGIVAVALGIFLVIYIVYILTAYNSLKRNVLPD